MKIATIPSKRRKDLIIIAILLIGLPILVFASYQVYQLIIRASVEAQPKNVALSNLTTSSVTVSWVTDVSATGSVVPVFNETEQSPVLDKRGSGRKYTHYVELTNLEPNTQYQFVIVSDSKKYTSEGEKTFMFKTAPITADTPTPNPIHGSVSGASGDDVMLFAMLKDRSTYPVSAIMPRGGNWIMDISALRSISDKSLVRVSDSTNIILIAISGVNQGAFVEGTYSELFDSNGKLKDVYVLNMGNDTTLYTHFPSESILDAYSTEPTLTSTPTPTPVTISEPIIERDPFERRYELVHDLRWIDMVTSGGAVSGVAGESSIEIVNLTDTGFSVIWVSEEREEGYVSYGTSVGSLSLDASDERDGITSRNPYYVHIVSLSRLQPETEYFFEINSGNEVYDNGGSKYRVTTFPTLSSPPPFDSIRGDVEGIPEHKEAVVVAHLQDEDNTGSQGKSSKIASSVDENGRWILSIADSRTEDGLSYFEYTSGDSLYIEVLTTFSTTVLQEEVEGIGERDIEIILEASEGVGYTEVNLLDNYGILGYSTGASLRVEEEGDTEEDYTVPEGTQTPKTGLFDSSALVSLSVLTLVGTITVVYISKVTKKSKKGNMKDNI